MDSKRPDAHSDEEVERRATEALRRGLNTPYQPQKKLVGKTERKRQPKASALPKSKE